MVDITQNTSNSSDDNKLQPGTLNYQPTGPEIAPIITVEPAVEKTSQEILTTPEKEPNTPKPQQDNTNKKDEIDTISNISSTVASNVKVVDKTEEVPPLHHIKAALDKTTKYADDEEEEFIKEVETVHGHK